MANLLSFPEHMRMSQFSVLIYLYEHYGHEDEDHRPGRSSFLLWRGPEDANGIATKEDYVRKPNAKWNTPPYIRPIESFLRGFNTLTEQSFQFGPQMAIQPT